MTNVETWIDKETEITVSEDDYILRLRDGGYPNIVYTRFFFDSKNPYNELTRLRAAVDSLLERHKQRVLDDFTDGCQGQPPCEKS